MSSPMRVEEFRDEGHLVVRAELPDIDPDEDVDITVSEHTLRLEAERRQESKTEEKDGYRSEFEYGRFTRTMTLPAGATEEDVTATYTDGVLEVRIPIDAEEEDAKRIRITRG